MCSCVTFGSSNDKQSNNKHSVQLDGKTSIQTESGLVFILGKFGRLNSDEQDELPEFGRKDKQEISNKQSVFDPAEAIRRTSRISPEEEEALRNTFDANRRFN